MGSDAGNSKTACRNEEVCEKVGSDKGDSETVIGVNELVER